jgi:alpha-N-arabinofuranosidase
MSVDEWGAWYNTEPGTNPGFLYQQNTVRDALIAGITLNIFNKHCDRVKMANLAQMVNVLQAVLLTEGEQMIKTPTYHVMHMYRHHQGASLLDSSLTQVDAVGPDEWVVPKVTESVSENAQGVITITLNNLSIEAVEKVDVQFARSGYQVVEAHIVSDSDMHAHNTFEAPETVTEKTFTGYELTEKGMTVTLPCNSVVEIRVAR